MSEIVLINVTGEDRPGITAALTAILARYQVPILDIGQSTIHNALALGLLVELPRSGTDCGVFKELLFSAHTLGLDIRFTPIAADDYEGWVRDQGQPRHILTLVGREIEAEHIARVSAVVAERGLNVDRITRLTGRISRRERLPAALASVELSVRGAVPDLTELHGALLALGRVLDVDISVQEDDIFRRNRRLVCFDMDSTLIQTEVIDELAAAAGVGTEVAANIPDVPPAEAWAVRTLEYRLVAPAKCRGFKTGHGTVAALKAEHQRHGTARRRHGGAEGAVGQHGGTETGIKRGGNTRGQEHPGQRHGRNPFQNE